MSKPKCVNIVQDGDRVLVTIRYPDTDEYHGYDAIYEGSIEDVMLSSFLRIVE
tara:strand:- start:34 stop:192 length:159 start_codon:yes stop_codon:yes gene_type:complete